MPKMNNFLHEKHRGGPTMSTPLLNVIRVLGVLGVLGVLNVLNIPKDALSVCWALLF